MDQHLKQRGFDMDFDIRNRFDPISADLIILPSVVIWAYG